MFHKSGADCLCEALNRGGLPHLGGHLLIRSPNWLGDAVMTMPAVAQILEQAKEKISVSILAPEKLHEVWKLLPSIKEILPAKKELSETVKLLRSKKFDSAILFPNSLRTGLEVFLGRVPVRIGYPGHWRRLLLTNVFEKEKTSQTYHQQLDYLHLIKELGFKIPEKISLPQVNRPQNSPLKDNYIAVCPGAEYGPAKRWPAERFAEAAGKIAEKYPLQIVLLGAKVDQPQAKDVEKRLQKNVINLTGKTTLSEFIAYLAHAKLVLCNDSGAMHLAALLKTPGIAIFGSTEPALTGPLSESIRVLREKTHCSPCFLRECPTYFECMHKVSVESVLQTAKEILQ